MVAQLTVNQLVASSNLAPGAKHKHFARAECFSFDWGCNLPMLVRELVYD